MSIAWRYEPDAEAVVELGEDDVWIVELDPEGLAGLTRDQKHQLGRWIAANGPAAIGLAPKAYTAGPHLTLIAEMVALLDGMEQGDKGPVTDSKYDALRDRARQHLADHGLTPVKGTAA